MTDDNDTDKVSKELDVLAIRMLDLMKQYIDLKMTMEDLVKTGSLHLAKSRYIMGNKSVSMLQLPTEDSELNALTKVVGSDGDVDDLRLELARMTVSSQAGDSKNSREDDPQEDGLKRRKGKGNKGDGVNDSKPDNEQDKTGKDEQNKSPKKKDVMQDPLKWFGVLVPQNMRLAQSSFNKALETTIELANVQLEMTSVRRKYSDLLIKKKELSSRHPEVAAET